MEHTMSPQDDVRAAVLEHPAVKGAAVRVDDAGPRPRTVCYVVPNESGPRSFDLDQVQGVNPHETQYLYDEIFVQRSYMRGGVTLREDAVVFDVGANIGMFSLFVLENCPSATLYAFEPLAPVYRLLERNAASAGDRVHVFRHGLADREADVSFAFYPGNSWMSGLRDYSDPQAEADVMKTYLLNERSKGMAKARDELIDHFDEYAPALFRTTEEPARLRRLSEVIDENGVERIDLLKVDVQRAELDVLHGLEERHWPLVQQIAMEVHDSTGSETEGRLTEVVSLLEKHGFTTWAIQDELLTGTDRHTLTAIRPEYAGDPRPVIADHLRNGGAARQEAELLDWLRGRLPGHLLPDAVVMVDSLPL
ncbi:hypothetical protein AV521_25790 [Streptomyces sp. IMTB 2501]|nr:hypothetical protein AV521_25790 [Streptomyces sp. IMTB 2501]